MATVEIILPGGPSPAWGADYTTPLRHRPYALYALASGAAIGTMTAGVDLCGGAPLDIVGSPIIYREGAIVGGNNAFRTPFTSEQLVNSGGHGATFACTRSDGVITAVTVTAGGSGYLQGGKVHYLVAMGGGGAGFHGLGVIGNDGDVAAVAILSGGTGYTSDPTFCLQGDAGMTMMMVARVPANQNFAGVGCLGGGPGAALTLDQSESGCAAIAIDTPALRQAYAQPAFADRGDRWAFYAATFRAQEIGVYERHKAGSLIGGVNQSATRSAFTRGAVMGIGQQPYSGGYPGVGEVMMVGFYDRALTPTEVGTVYADTALWLNELEAAL